MYTGLCKQGLQAIIQLLLTSGEFLYHLLCSSSAHKLDGFGSGWLAPETAMWTDCAVMSPPSFDDDLGFSQRVKQLAVEQLIAHLPLNDSQ